MTVSFDPAHGGRWTSLRTGTREWLWSRPDPARATVHPGSSFVDVGGVEECVPTVRGVPDHGDVWCRSWSDSSVVCPDFTFSRTVLDSAELVYRLSAAPGYRFVWAAHALLELSPSARLRAPAGTVTRVYDQPGFSPWVAGPWPTPLGLPLDRLGPWDGTAIGAILTDCPEVRVDDGETLSFRLDAPGQPVSVALWRNLGGFPQPSPYRSIGVEPMLGKVFDLREAGPGDAATVPSSGVCEWRLHLST